MNRLKEYWGCMVVLYLIMRMCFYGTKNLLWDGFLMRRPLPPMSNFESRMRLIDQYKFRWPKGSRPRHSVEHKVKGGLSPLCEFRELIYKEDVNTEKILELN